MPLNPYFLQGSTSEQRLVQDLINEQLRMYGQDIVYLPRKIINKKSIIKEIVSSSFDDAYRLEAYLLNYQGFEGNGDVLSKFGVTTTDAVNLVVSKEKYEDFITPFLGGDSQVELSTRPQEGDLVYLPLDNTMFEIKYVEARKPFYQLNNLYVYTLTCEVMDAELDQDINTSIEAVDTSVDEFGFIVTLGMVGLAASTAAATVQKATSVSGLTTGFSIGSIDLINDGTGYTAAPEIGISTTGFSQGVNATAVAIMTSRDGQTGQSIDKILITNPGFGYTEAPTVTIRSVNVLGSGGIATAIIANDGLSVVTVTDGGDEYGEIPNVVFNPTTVGAAATVTVSAGGTITSFNITNTGGKYISAPPITVAPPTSGTTATGIASISAAGIVTSITITNPGAGYTFVPAVTISNEVGIKTFSGTNAQGIVVLNTVGEVAAIRYTNTGAGYTVAPTIVIDSPAAAGFSTGNYLYKEMVRGVGSGTTAFVQEWDFDARILKVTRPSGSFVIGEAVVGIGTTQNGSDAKYIVKTASTQDDTDAFNENTPFETEADAILDFSEGNPFGEF